MGASFFEGGPPPAALLPRLSEFGSSQQVGSGSRCVRWVFGHTAPGNLGGGGGPISIYNYLFYYLYRNNKGCGCEVATS